jgi:hypothetical protein
VLIKFEQGGGNDIYVIDPTHIVAVVREHNEGGDSVRVIVRTVDGCEYAVAGDYADIVEQVDAAHAASGSRRI